MFSITNIYTKASTVIRVALGESYVDFIISNIISKRNKEELDDNRQFLLLNEFCNWKGKEFKEKLFQLYTQSANDILDTATMREIYPLPTYITNPILDMFNLDEVIHFVKDVYKLQPPSNLADEFDEMIEKDGRGTRVQTYIKSDYIELASLVVIVKAIIGPIGQFAYVRSRDFNTVHKEYILLQMLRQHINFQSEPANKLLGLIDKVVNLPTNDQELNSIRKLEKQLPEDEIPVAVMAIVVIQKLPICCVVDDDKDKNIVTKVYNYVNNKLKSVADSTKSIKPKTSLTDADSGTGDKESIIESTRISGNLSTATPLEISWAVDSVEKILSQCPKYMLDNIDTKIVNDAMNFTKVFRNGNLNKTQVDTLSFLFKDILDPRALDYIDIDSLINMLSVGFAYVWGLGFKQLALLLVSQQDVNQDKDTITINSTVNRTRISKEAKDMLTELFPYKRVINDTTEANLVEELITNLVNDIFDVRWYHTATEEYVKPVLGDMSPDKILPIDLKLQLADLIIMHESKRSE